jgi:alginate O-acetyltransferase complex protein AlgI
MYFTSMVFLLLFLPVFVILYAVAGQKQKNLVALAASVIFLAWNQPLYLPLMAVVILGNYYLGKEIEKTSDQINKKRLFLSIGWVANLLILLFFKAIVAYGVEWLPKWSPEWLVTTLNQYLMPLGFSYLVFQLISYQVDIYNGICASEKSLYSFTLYVALFPKILIGPILRYRDLFAQIIERQSNSRDMADGLRRFFRGLVKKILIADTIADVINPAFSLSTPNFSTGIAWFVLVGYALQLYFDFSGYTDMAIGLGQIMGFRFMENFNYPYISKSIAEFWRRWHITLSTWFREYVFYPLELSRRKLKVMIQPLNIFIVFLLTGLWHGITLNYLLWGGVHGIALAFELTPVGKKLKKLWAPLQHLYALIVILAGWVFFRSATLDYALNLFARLMGSSKGITQLPYSITRPLPIIDHSVWLAFILGIIFSTPVVPWLCHHWERITEKSNGWRFIGQLVSDLFLVALLLLSIAALVYRNTAPTSIYQKY